MTVVYIAANRNEAEALKGILAREGILATTRPIAGWQGFGEEGNYEVLVPETEAEEAQELVSMAVGRSAE